MRNTVANSLSLEPEFNLTSSEAVELGNTIKPLILKGHSPYQIIAAHPELGISEKTLYNYIEQGVFECVGIANIDLRIKVKSKNDR